MNFAIKLHETCLSITLMIDRNILFIYNNNNNSNNNKCNSTPDFYWLQTIYKTKWYYFYRVSLHSY
ncbi:hypothetical protein KSF78_0000181 [Schistosoma japonicum]|nr:hypothetical protein KSF78_0000181 [Schistosoma japonicum]